MFETLDEKPEADLDGEARPPVKGEVELDHVSFGYSKEAPVLRDVSLHVAPGQTVALVGPTGAGKTTVLNLLTRFHEIDEGTIRVDGEDIRRWNKRDLRRALAKPAILLLDEATSSIDTADRVLVIDGGRIVEEGTHDEFLARRGFYHHLYQSQFKGHAL